eukprot:scaffold6592_cov29-Phaeocystis_antarctica.AAC.1
MKGIAWLKKCVAHPSLLPLTRALARCQITVNFVGCTQGATSVFQRFSARTFPQAHAALGLPFTCPLKNAWPAEASSLASNPLKARRQRRRGRPRLSDGDGRRAFVYVLVLRCASWESSSQAEDGGNEMVTRQ